MREINNLELHQEIEVEDHFIMRVPGGLIYTDRRGSSAVGTFVPYDFKN